MSSAFPQFELKPTDRLEISGFGGVNNRDWLVKDSDAAIVSMLLMA